MQKTKTLFIILILATVVVVSGCSQKQQPQNNQVQNQAQQNQGQTEPEGITSEVDTSDWKTYRNEEYGFELKYPGDWKIGKKKDSSIEHLLFLLSPETKVKIDVAKKTFIPLGDIVIKGYEIEKDQRVIDFLEKNKKNFEIININKINIGDQGAFEVVMGGYSKNYSVFVKNKNKVIRLYFELVEEKGGLNSIERKIISSIKLF